MTVSLLIFLLLATSSACATSKPSGAFCVIRPPVGVKCLDKDGNHTLIPFEKADGMLAMTPGEYGSQMNACKENN